MLTEAKHAGCYLVQEGNGFYSRDALMVALSQNLVAGQVCGRRAVPSAVVSSAAADAANTVGGGAITIDGTAPVSAGVQNGRYRAVCIEPASNSGTFEVFDPQGVSIGKVVVPATFNNQIKFVIADATDFVAGDAFNIDVIVEDGADTEVAALDFAAADGLQIANCISFAPVVTDGTTKQKATFTVRHSEVRASDLTWPAGATANQIAAAVEQLRGKGIILR